VRELFPRVGFIVTSITLPSRSLVRFYNKRGTAEQWIKEGKQATNWTRLSCHRFRANEVRVQLAVLAYNLGNLWRRLGLPRRIKSWSLTSLQAAVDEGRWSAAQALWRRQHQPAIQFHDHARAFPSRVGDFTGCTHCILEGAIVSTIVRGSCGGRCGGQRRPWR
jgi:Transposase DDE domain group 1